MYTTSGKSFYPVEGVGDGCLGDVKVTVKKKISTIDSGENKKIARQKNISRMCDENNLF